MRGFPRRDLYLAGALARLAAPRLAAGEGTAPGALRPLYLRAADIRPERPMSHAVSAPAVRGRRGAPDDVDALASLERRCYTHPWSVRGFREALRRGEHVAWCSSRARPRARTPSAASSATA